MREPGPTFKLEDICFFDWETHSTVNIADGTYRYMAHATPLILAYSIAEKPARALSFPLAWDEAPQDLRDHCARVARNEAVLAAWNAGFDREAWNQLTDFPILDPHHVIDVMAQATAAGLPGALDGAARLAGASHKSISGKGLIKLFCLPDSAATRETHPDDWNRFLAYAAQDIVAMRDVFRRTAQLPIEDWQEYWASEQINLNGIAFDDALARAAAAMAIRDKTIAAAELTGLTNGAVTAVTRIKSMIDWLKTALPAEDHGYLVREMEKVDEDTGEVKSKERLTLDRSRIALLTALLDAKPTLTDGETKARQLLDIRRYGGSTTPAKYSRMLASHVDGRLHGQFVFNGAPQTGRFSSRIVQLHNLMRDALPYEPDAIDALLDGVTPERFRSLGDDTVISRKLSMLIRPTLIPECRDNAFVWGDWSQIEARILGWLAGADDYLDVFRAVDADPSLPDLYVRSAAAMSGVTPAEVSPELRQRGKVAVLAAGFGGGRNALQAMASNYGMHLSDDEAQQIVTEWRDANPWAVDYWNRLWKAFDDAMKQPCQLIEVGRIGYIFLPDYLGGTVLARLPSGRFLTYRKCKWERIDELDDNGVVIDSRIELTFARSFGRSKIWRGILVENLVQATAADVLRGTLARLVYGAPLGMVRAHTHDEILMEVHEDRAEDVAVRLTDEMQRGFEWSKGLPLKAETTIGRSYTKCKAAQGL